MLFMFKAHGTYMIYRMRRNSKENIFSSNHSPIKRNSTADGHVPIIHRLPKDFLSKNPLPKLKLNPSNVDQQPPFDQPSLSCQTKYKWV